MTVETGDPDRPFHSFLLGSEARRYWLSSVNAEPIEIHWLK